MPQSHSLSARFRKLSLWTIALIGVALGGLWVGQKLKSLYGQRPQSTAQLLRALKKHDSRLDLLRQEIWEKLPVAVSRRLPDLQPREAAVVRAEASERLISVARTDEVELALVEGLSDSVLDVRRNVIAALGQMEAQSEKARAALIPLLGDHDIVLRTGAIKALGNIRLAASSLVPKFIELLDDPNYWVRLNAWTALAKAPAENKEVAQTMINVLTRSSISEKEAMVAALGNHNVTGEHVLPVLVSGVGDQDPMVRRFEAVKFVGELGADASAVLPVLVTLQNDEKTFVRLAVQKALKALRD